jgi:flagellar hook-associated protein 2
MSGSINFNGLASGIDTASIISEMIAIDRQPETAIQTAQTALQAQQTAYNTVSAKLLALQATTYPLDALRGFSLVTAASSTATVASVTAVTGAQTGTHTINVTSLAQSQVISTSVQTSQTAPLGQSGQIIINGTAISYQAADSLQTFASNINAAQPGLTASIISPTSGQYYLTLGSTNSGVEGKISISDAGTGTLLGGTLGMFSGTSSFAHTLSPSGHGSALFADSATSIATLEGLTTPASGTVTLTVGGVAKTVSIDLSQSLSQIAQSINAGAAGTAQVVTVTDPITNTSKQQLQLNSTVTAFTDNKNLLANLGIVQSPLAAGNELTQAKDAVFTIDTLAATRPTNSFSDAISGVTINLLTPGTTNLTVSSDTTTIKSNIQAFVTAYNDTLDNIDTQSQYDPTSGTTGVLFGDSTTQNIFDSLVSNTNGSIPGLPSNLSLLSQVGITIDQNDRLQIDDATLSSQLTSNLSGVAKLFQASGTSSDPSVQFVSAAQTTVPSSTSGYAVHVFTPASQATYVSSSNQTLPLAADETLTFGGPLFGSSASGSPLQGYSLQLHAGATAAAIVSQINADTTIGPLVSASLTSGGNLQLISKQYGSTADFAVVSSASIGPDTSSIGTTPTEVQGVDVVGTINGETASGIGQFLTGSQTAGVSGTNGLALGLQLRVTATAAGNYGTMVYTSGVADVVKNYITGQTDAYTGALTTAVAGLQTQIDGDTSDIADIEARLTDEQTTLQQQFTAMEVAVAQIKAASSGLAALGVSASSSSSSSTSSSLQ